MLRVTRAEIRAMCGNIGDIEQARRPAELFLAASPNACLGVYPGVHVSRGQMQCLAPTSFIPVTLNSLRSVSGTLGNRTLSRGCCRHDDSIYRLDQGSTKEATRFRQLTKLD